MQRSAAGIFSSQALATRIPLPAWGCLECTRPLRCAWRAEEKECVVPLTPIMKDRPISATRTSDRRLSARRKKMINARPISPTLVSRISLIEFSRHGLSGKQTSSGVWTPAYTKTLLAESSAGNALARYDDWTKQQPIIFGAKAANVRTAHAIATKPAQQRCAVLPIVTAH